MTTLGWNEDWEEEEPCNLLELLPVHVLPSQHPYQHAT